MAIEKYLVKATYGSLTIHTGNPVNIFTGLGVRIPNTVFNACILYGAEVRHKGVKMVRVLAENE